MIVRIGKPELVAVGILDDHQPLAPPTVLEHDALRQKISAERIMFGVAEGKIDRALADPVRPLRVEQKRAIVPADPGRKGATVLIVPPVHREAELVDVECRGCAGVANEQDRAIGPSLCHGGDLRFDVTDRVAPVERDIVKGDIDMRIRYVIRAAERRK